MSIKSDTASSHEIEENYRRIAENAIEGICKIDAQLKITFLNKSMASILGYDRDELVGKPIDLLVPKESLPRVLGNLSGRTTGVVENAEVEFLRKDGSLALVALVTVAEFDSAGGYAGAVAFASDITGQREMEAELWRSRKLAAVGRLASGIAHEFRNVLMGISAYTELLQMQAGLDERTKPLADDILACVDRGSKLSGQLLAFSRKQSLFLTQVDLNALITNISKLLRQVLGEHIALEIELAPALPSIDADPGQIEQVILNMAVNARDVMQSGGRLTIRTCYEEAGNSGEDMPGGRILLSISDTGSETAIEHAPDPMSDNAAGDEFGLPIVHRIIQQHKGHIDVTSVRGKGTEFAIYLPAGHLKPIPAQLRDLCINSASSKTILLAEDEKIVREPMRLSLTQAGYEVLCTQNGQAAIDAFREHSGAIDLVILDLVMPGTGGAAAWHQIQSIRPDVRVLFMSGYAAGAEPSGFEPPPDLPVLQKPFPIGTLIAEIARILETNHAK